MEGRKLSKIDVAVAHNQLSLSLSLSFSFTHSLYLSHTHTHTHTHTDSHRSRDIDSIETAAVGVFTSLVLRLADSAFRPMLWKLISWGEGSPARLHTLLRVAHALVGELKTLFLP